MVEAGVVGVGPGGRVSNNMSSFLMLAPRFIPWVIVCGLLAALELGWGRHGTTFSAHSSSQRSPTHEGTQAVYIVHVNSGH